MIINGKRTNQCLFGMFQGTIVFGIAKINGSQIEQFFYRCFFFCGILRMNGTDGKEKQNEQTD
jgi:hypothetical protein